VPVFLLPIYQAAGIQYGVRWEIVAAINEIETDYGRNLNVSTAGAVGWMQFLPSTWRFYGVDGNRDERAASYSPWTPSSPRPGTWGRRAIRRIRDGRCSPTTTPNGTSSR
jgi:soluble lytic murein transglycosylase-like protein